MSGNVELQTHQPCRETLDPNPTASALTPRCRVQSLLDVAIQEQNLENSNDTARIGQLMEVLAIKDEANRDLHRGVQELEAALAEARMNLEYLHSKWRDEAVAREEADTTIKLLRSQIDASQVRSNLANFVLVIFVSSTHPNLFTSGAIRRSIPECREPLLLRLRGVNSARVTHPLAHDHVLASAKTTPIREAAAMGAHHIKISSETRQAEAERHVRLCAAAQEQAYIATEDAAVRLEAQQVTDNIIVHNAFV
jgi:hypothetical protein